MPIEQDHVNYNRIEQAIHYIRNNFREQPSLEDIAWNINLSPYHFQRLFSDWAGVSPKKFLQYVSVEYSKQILKYDQATLLDVAYDVGLSGTSRLHDLFIKIEGMTPGEYKNQGQNLIISYSYAQSPFGLVLIASTRRGLCHLSFVEENEDQSFDELKRRFSKATFQKKNRDDSSRCFFYLFSRQYKA